MFSVPLFFSLYSFAPSIVTLASDPSLFPPASAISETGFWFWEILGVGFDWIDFLYALALASASFTGSGGWDSEEDGDESFWALIKAIFLLGVVSMGDLIDEEKNEYWETEDAIVVEVVESFSANTIWINLSSTCYVSDLLKPVTVEYIFRTEASIDFLSVFEN